MDCLDMLWPSVAVAFALGMFFGFFVAGSNRR
jgi:hypothetical protein